MEFQADAITIMYSDRRRNPIRDQQGFEQSLEELASAFTEEWLRSDSNHPLQVLWRRRDVLSSTELILLGDSLGKIKTLNRAWVLDAISKVKGDNANNRQGAVLEIITAGIWHNPPYHTVELPPPGTPGYDVVVRLPDASRIFVSIRNYGRSIHSQAVVREAEMVEQIVKRSLGGRSMQVAIAKAGNYPDPIEWKVLKSQLPMVLQAARTITNIKAGWRIHVSPLDLDRAKLHPARASYSILVSTPFHKNEDQNLYSKLDKACSDFEKAAPVESLHSMNLVFIHIPVDASLELCAEWADIYLQVHPAAPISGVLLYQPTVVTDTDRDQSWVGHAYVDRFRGRKFEDWVTAMGRKLSPCFPVGKPQDHPTEQVLDIGGKRIPVRREYLYQSGHIYYRFQAISGEPATGHVRAIFGVHTHAIFQIEGQEIELSGIFPPKHELVLL